MRVYLIGAGMGRPESLTVEAGLAIDACRVLVGAPRLLEPYRGEKECVPLNAAGEIYDFIRTRDDGPVGVLLSGDAGFYSGAKSLWTALGEDYDVAVVAGVSSLSYLCARLKTAWQDVKVVSALGRNHNAVGEIQAHAKTFVLTGGATKAQDVCRAVRDWGMSWVTLSVGENLSYPDERIVTGTAEELAGQEFADLAVVLAVNPDPVFRGFSNPGIPDETFLRGEAPITGEEVRTLSLSKLRLCPHHVLWDIGAGVGAVSVEAGLSLPAGRVYAVERDPACLELLAKNKERFGVTNMHLVAGQAPDVLAALPDPDRVFLGCGADVLAECLDLVFRRNPAARVVVSADSLQALTLALECFQRLELTDVDVAQLAVTKAKGAGTSHRMTAQDPVWLVSGEGKSCGLE